jgi:RHS repeat-associated protein
LRYSPYGENTEAEGAVSYSELADPFLYKGGYHLTGGNTGVGNVPNGLYQFGARYYDPTSGAWTQSDPGTSDPVYEYAGGDPINEEDATGCKHAGSPAGRYAEHQCDLLREGLPERRRNEIGNFVRVVGREAGIKGEWSYELEYRKPLPIFVPESPNAVMAGAGGEFGNGAICHIILNEIGKNKFRVAKGGEPHFRPTPSKLEG